MGKEFLVKNSDPATIRKTGWNRMRLVVAGNSITVVMNGTTVVKTNDALAIQHFVLTCRPRRIIEIGGGYSTAAMMDAVDRCGVRSRQRCRRSCSK